MNNTILKKNFFLDLLNDPKAIYLGLVDLLFAYSYNHRFTEGENNIESAWTIGKISPTISSLEVGIQGRGKHLRILSVKCS